MAVWTALSSSPGLNTNAPHCDDDDDDDDTEGDSDDKEKEDPDGGFAAETVDNRAGEEAAADEEVGEARSCPCIRKTNAEGEVKE